MSNVIEFAHDMRNPASIEETLFVVRRLRREASRTVLTPEGAELVFRLLDDVETDILRRFY